MLVQTKPDQTEAQQWRSARLETQAALFSQQLPQAFAALRRIQPREIHFTPGQGHLRHNDLHRPAQALMRKRDPQIGMALQQRLCGYPQCIAIQWPFQTDRYLDRVEIGSLRVVKSMEQ